MICFVLFIIPLVHCFNVMTFPASNLKNCKTFDSHAIRLNANKAPFHTSNTDQARGLGGGIEWALSDSFCPKLINSRAFREYGLSCEAITQSIERAMTIWSDRHPYIYFSRMQDNARAEVVFDVYDSSKSTRSDDVLGYQQSEIIAESIEILGTVKGMKRKSPLRTTSIFINRKHCWFRRSRRECFDADDEAKFLINMGEGFALLVIIAMLWTLGSWGASRKELCRHLEKGIRETESQLQEDNLERETVEGRCTKLSDCKNEIPQFILDCDLKLSEGQSTSLWGHYKKAFQKSGKADDFLVQILAVTLSDLTNAMESLLSADQIAQVVKAQSTEWNDDDDDGDDVDPKGMMSCSEWIDEWIDSEREAIGALERSAIFHKKKLEEKTVQLRMAKEAEMSLVRVRTCVHWLLLPLVGALFVTYHFIICPFSLFGRGCTNFETVVAHEIGHVLGLDHPDDARFLDRIQKKNARDRNIFIAVNDTDLCRDITVRRLDHACADITSHHDCVSVPYCKLDERYDVMSTAGSNHVQCTTIFSGSLMASHLGRDEVVDRLSQDDLAALFFLYPSPKRKSAWGLNPIPLRDWEVVKLKALASREAVAQCKSDDLVVCILIHRLQQVTKKFDKFQAKCRGDKSGSFCSSLTELGSVLHRGLAFAEAAVLVDDKDDAVAHKLHEELVAARDVTERVGSHHIALDEKFLLDDYIEAFTHSLIDDDHDANEDGVHDEDVDADALPDEIEKGIDALLEVLKELGAGGGLVGHHPGDAVTRREEVFDAEFDKYDRMTVKQLRAAVREAGLEKETRGFAEKEDFVRVLVEWATNK